MYACGDASLNSLRTDGCLMQGYAFQMEIMVRAEYCGCHVEEVPIVFVDRFYGQSKLGKSEIVGFLRGLAYLFVSL